MRGRKPKPTRLKVVTGNPGKRPLNAQEPRPKLGVPSCPSHLDREARAEWRRMARELSDMGLLAKIDRSMLAAYCVAWSRWVKAEKAVAKKGEVLTSAAGGTYANPQLHVANRAMEQMRQFAQMFGFDPSSRSRLKVPDAGKDADPFEDFFRGQSAG